MNNPLRRLISFLFFSISALRSGAEGIGSHDKIRADELAQDHP